MIIRIVNRGPVPIGWRTAGVGHKALDLADRDATRTGACEVAGIPGDGS